MTIKMIKMGDLFTFEKGTLQSSKCTTGEFTFITAAEEWKTHNEYSHDTEAIIYAVAASGSLGRAHYYNGKFITSDLCLIFQAKNPNEFPVNFKFYQFILNELREKIVLATKSGTSKEAISQKNLTNYMIPYFSLDKQNYWETKFISVNKIKDELKCELEGQANTLKKLRQQILQDAISGKLTEKWRAENPNVEPATELLKRINAEKERLVKEKKIKKQDPLPPILDEEVPFELPEGWVWCRLGDITQFTTSGSRGWGNLISESGAMFIRTQNISDNHLNLNSDIVHVNLDGNTEGTRTKLELGDILTIITGSNISKSAVVEHEISEAYINQHIALSRPIISMMANWIHTNILNSKTGNKHLIDSIYGSGKPSLNLDHIRSIPITLPSIYEQAEIINNLNNKLTLINILENQFLIKKTKISLVNQSILKEAFEG